MKEMIKMIGMKKAILRNMFSTSDPADSLPAKQDQFVRSMEHLTDLDDVPDYSVTKKQDKKTKKWRQPA